ncbi:hypothetical protein [Quadrisphaera sp. INWT6]|uniref:hypothetical protein n=1 Tax=Quadrisphaera sp. INWT6 TaxID=2596917 RepID=UPI0018920C0B|nr:hypothetical protein [Quadrisphaera sp. INWT6]MBF5082040.1 hypothetical protein [Quadrisphaera sp. INWT6]
MTARLLVGPGDADERVVRRWAGRALGLLARHAPDAASLAAALAPAGLGPATVTAAHGELLHRLRTAPASGVWFDLAADPAADPAGAAGVAAARREGLAVRGEAAPVVLGLRAAASETGWAALDAAVAALVATAERGADAPEVELGALPERLLVVLVGPDPSGAPTSAQAETAASALSALEGSHGLPPGWLVLEPEPLAQCAPVLSAAEEADAAAVGAVWAEHARLALEARAAGLAPGWDRHPAHLVARHLADLAGAAG